MAFLSSNNMSIWSKDYPQIAHQKCATDAWNNKTPRQLNEQVGALL